MGIGSTDPRPTHTQSRQSVRSSWLALHSPLDKELIQGPSVSVVPLVPLAPYSQVQTTEDPVVFTAEKTVLTGGPV